MLENIITEIISRGDLSRGLDSIQCRTILREIKGNIDAYLSKIF